MTRNSGRKRPKKPKKKKEKDAVSHGSQTVRDVAEIVIALESEAERSEASVVLDSDVSDRVDIGEIFVDSDGSEDGDPPVLVESSSD